MTELPTETHLEAARAVLRELNLREAPHARRLVSGHRSSLPIVADSLDGRTFLLKYYLPLPPQTILPAGVRADDYSRREVGFYRDLSDAYITQTVTPRYQIGLDGKMPGVAQKGGVA